MNQTNNRIREEKFIPSTAPCKCGYEEVRHKTCKFCMSDKFPNQRR